VKAGSFAGVGERKAGWESTTPKGFITVELSGVSSVNIPLKTRLKY
jgi:hypothetical protein